MRLYRRPAPRSRLFLTLAGATVALYLGGAQASGAQQPLDLLISGARVYDGSGNPWFYADVGIRAGRIVAVGRLGERAARTRIDARGRALMPGVIDLHSHADDGSSSSGGFRDRDPRRRAALNLVTQGVTTVVVNQDGRSPLPIRDQKRAIDSLGIGPNAILLVGHGSVRSAVMGRDVRRPARADEVERMGHLVRQGMEEGAWGMSAGLEYAPGRWSTTEEVVALTRQIVPFQGVYISHERSEGQDPMWYWPSQDAAGPPTLLDAIRETIEIGERSGATVVASHIKTKGANYWGSGRAAMQLIESARARGVDVWADQYPYATSGSDGSTVLIPTWAIAVTEAPIDGARGAADYRSALRRVMADSVRNANLRRDIEHEIQRRGGAKQVVVFDHPVTDVVGKSIEEIAALWKVSPVDAAIQLQVRGYADRPGGGRVRGFSLSELDIEAYAAQPWVATASDAGIALPSDGPAVHARFYGTFPRKIRHYALTRGVLSVESAIRSMTSLPAQILGLRDRGLIREGLVADLVLIDLDRLRDKATFVDPHQYAEGVEYVWLGGAVIVEQGKPNGALIGRTLSRATSRQ